jgi:hypothetical protein
MKETATPCRHFVEKTADDCPECAYFEESPMGYGSGYCRYPEIVRPPEKAKRAKFRVEVDSANLEGRAYRSGEEERFKQDTIKEWERATAGISYFCIESPGAADGFPDVLALGSTGQYGLFEFKVSDKRGVIHFERTQPLFYRKHRDLDILIVAWNVPMARVERVQAESVVSAKSLRFQLPKQ